MKNTIRVERAKRGVTQKQLAEATGLRHTTISYTENERRCPNVCTSLKIARFFKLNVEDIFETYYIR